MKPYDRIKTYIPAFLLFIVAMLIVISSVLHAQNSKLKADNDRMRDQLNSLQKTADNQEAILKSIQNSNSQIAGFLKCVSLTPIERRDANFIDFCFKSNDIVIPPQTTPGGTNPSNPQTGAPGTSSTTINNDNRTTTQAPSQPATPAPVAPEPQPGIACSIPVLKLVTC